MTTTNNFDSDWDYYEACMRREQSLAWDILDGEALGDIVEDFNYYLDKHPELDEYKAALQYSTNYFKQQEEI